MSSLPLYPSAVAQANWAYFLSLTNSILAADQTLCGSVDSFCFDAQGKCPSGAGISYNSSIFEMWVNAFKQVMGEFSTFVTSYNECGDKVIVYTGCLGPNQNTFYTNLRAFYSNGAGYSGGLVNFLVTLANALTCTNDCPAYNIQQMPLSESGPSIVCESTSSLSGLLALTNILVSSYSTNSIFSTTTLPAAST